MSDEEGPSHTKGVLTTKGFAAHRELRLREFFQGPSELIFRERLEAMGLAPRMGDTSHFFWYDHDLVKAFKDGAQIDKKTKKLVVVWNGKPYKILPKHVEVASGLKRNPRYNEDTQDSYLNARLFDKKEPRPLLQAIAPYADQSHLVPSQNAIRAKGLQENQLLVAKWFTRNMLGTELIHLVNGRAAWFLLHLMKGDLLEIGWCPIEALLESLKHATTTGGFPLPVLMCLLMSMIQKIKDIPEEHERIQPPKRLYDFFRCDIPGYWTNFETPNPVPIYLEDPQAWRVWRFKYGNDNLGGGWSYHTKGGMDDGSVYVRGEASTDDQNVERAEQMETETATDMGTRVETVVAESEQMRSYSRRRRRDRVEQDAPTPFPTLPYTYSVPDAPFTPYYPSVAWPTAAFLEPGLHSRVPPQYQSDAVLHAIPYLARMIDGLHAHLETDFRFDGHVSAPGGGSSRPGGSGTGGTDEDTGEA